MALNDPLGDMIARIHNAQMRAKPKVSTPSSRLRMNVLEVLKNEGFINDYQKFEENSKAQFKIGLKYHEGENVIKEVVCISKPGRRVYCEISKLPKYYNGLGIAILSTSKGVMSDFDARVAGVGGEVLCYVA